VGRLKLNEQISEEAAEWLVEFRMGDIDAEGRRAFDEWVRSSPEHLRAFLEIAAIWNEGGALDAAREIDLDALIARARTEQNVVPISQATIDGNLTPASGSDVDDTGPRANRGSSRSRVKFRSYAAVATVLMTSAAAFLLWNSLYAAPTYSTGVGENRTITLRDGSTVALDSRTKIRIRFTDDRRLVELQGGQALFHVAKNPARPFIVKSGATQVRAIGTAFDVYKQDDGTLVTVVEGRVAVLTPLSAEAVAMIGSSPIDTSRASLAFPVGETGGSGNVFLSAGEQLRVTRQAVKKSAHPNIASATAWTESKVILDSASLAEVADDFNRYSTRRLIVEDLGATPLRLSGIFTTNPDLLLKYLRERPDITIVENDSEIRIVRRTPD
jgi:transmembrane sensor